MTTAEERIEVAAANDIPGQYIWENIVEELSNVHLEKAIEYGTDRYRQDVWTEEEENWMIYSDVYRKFIRLREQMKRGDRAGMRETLKDLANYGIFGMQLIDLRG